MKKGIILLIIMCFIFSLGAVCFADEETTTRQVGDVTVDGGFKTGVFTPADNIHRPETFWTYGFQVGGDVVVHDRISLSGSYYYLSGSDKNFNPTGDFSIQNLEGKCNFLISKEETIFPLNVWAGVKHLRIADTTVLYGEDNSNFTGFGFGIEKKANLKKDFDFNFRLGYYPVLVGGSHVDNLDGLDIEVGGTIKVKENLAIKASYFYERWGSDVESQYLLPTYGITVSHGTATLKGINLGIDYKF